MPEKLPSRPAGGGELLALADRCVQCGLCLAHGPTYRLDAAETESPRGRIAYMKAVAVGSLAPTALGDLHLDHCLGCRRCEGACPAGVEYGRLLLAGRSAQFERQAPPPRLRRRLWLLSRPRLLSALLAAYRSAYSWLPARARPLPRPPAKPRGSRQPAPADDAPALFLGCVARAYEAPAREALRRLLAAAGLGLAEPENQGCCGAAAAHAGDGGEAAAARARSGTAGGGVARSRLLRRRRPAHAAVPGTCTRARRRGARGPRTIRGRGTAVRERGLSPAPRRWQAVARAPSARTAG